MAGSCDVIAQAQARDTGELGNLAASRVQVLGGVTRTMSCPVAICRRPIAVDHHTTIHEVGEGGVQAACSCGWRSAVFGADKTVGRRILFSSGAGSARGKPSAAQGGKRAL